MHQFELNIPFDRASIALTFSRELRCLGELRGKHTSPTIIKAKTLMELLSLTSTSPKFITINQLSILKAACLNNSNKNASYGSAVYLKSFKRDLGPCLFLLFLFPL